MSKFRLEQPRLLVTCGLAKKGMFEKACRYRNLTPTMVVFANARGVLIQHVCCRRLDFEVTAQPGSFWISARRPLLQYVRLLTAAAAKGDSAEVGWLLSKEPADLSDLQPEAFHCPLFAAVLCGHHKTVETLLQHQNPEKAALQLPACSDFTQPEEPISFLGMAYAWEYICRLKLYNPRFSLGEEERQTLHDRGHYSREPPYLGLMQLLLEYGVRPASGIEGLLQRLAYTADMAAVATLQAHHFDIGECQLADGRTLLHLLVSSRTHENDSLQYGNEQSRWAAHALYETHIKEWQHQAAPLLKLLLSSPGATLRRDQNGKTAIDVCLPEYKQFMSDMKNPRMSAQPVQRGHDGSGQTHCVVCMDRRPSVVLIPCGHLCVCQPCSSRLQQQCPICRAAVTQMIQTYLP